MDLTLRPELPDDVRAVFDVNRRAFETDAEARLVDLLRETAALWVSLVAEVDGVVRGHISFSPVTISGVDDLCLGLGPMAVHPEVQNRGIGTRLVEEGLARCRALGAAAVFVLGHPDYYPRFGFGSAVEEGFRYKDERFDPYFFVIQLTAGFKERASGVVRYHPVFDTV